jgi:hypothetical protein
MKAVLRSTQFRIVLGAIMLYLLWQVWLSIAAPGKISAGIERSKSRVSILITLPFVPERFHVLMFQRFGRVSGTQEHSIELRGVDPAQLNAIARYYWVSRIDPLPIAQ